MFIIIFHLSYILNLNLLINFCNDNAMVFFQYEYFIIIVNTLTTNYAKLLISR